MLPGRAPLDDALGGNLRNAQDDDGVLQGGAPLDDALGGNLRGAQDDDGAAQVGAPMEQTDAASELSPDLFDLPVGSLREVLGLDPPRISHRTFPRLWTIALRRLLKKSVGRLMR